MSDRVIRFPEKPVVLAEVGGLVDQSSVTLGIYGDDLDPGAISRVLNCRPTSSHKKGDPPAERDPPLPPWPSGAWLLAVHGQVPKGPEELSRKLLMRLPADPAVWKKLAARYEVRVYFGIHMDAWNRGFDLSPETIERMGVFGATVGFDIYANADDV